MPGGILTLFLRHNKLEKYVSVFMVGIDLKSIVHYLKMKVMKNFAIDNDLVINIHNKTSGYSTVTLWLMISSGAIGSIFRIRQQFG
jgi:hypothetical protein